MGRPLSLLFASLIVASSTHAGGGGGGVKGGGEDYAAAIVRNPKSREAILAKARFAPDQIDCVLALTPHLDHDGDLLSRTGYLVEIREIFRECGLALNDAQ